MTEPETTTEHAPTFDEAVAAAASTLNEARMCAGMDAAPRLVSVADSYLALAQVIDRRERCLD